MSSLHFSQLETPSAVTPVAEPVAFSVHNFDFESWVRLVRPQLLACLQKQSELEPKHRHQQLKLRRTPAQRSLSGRPVQVG